MNASDYLENKLLDHVLRGTAYTTPTLYIGLYTSSTGLESNAPTGEVTGGGYVRRKVTDYGTYTAAAAGSSSNTAVIDFPVASADWGTITHMALCDALSGGNVLIWAALTTPKTITNGDMLRLNAGAHTVSMN